MRADWVRQARVAVEMARETRPGRTLETMVRRVVTAVVVDELRVARAPLAETEVLLGEIRAAVPGMERRARAAGHRLEQGPFHGGMTVHAAHDRHPGVAAIFAARRLPACPQCAVGADETLGEAAFGEGFGLDDLLRELNLLLRV